MRFLHCFECRHCEYTWQRVENSDYLSWEECPQCGKDCDEALIEELDHESFGK